MFLISPRSFIFSFLVLSSLSLGCAAVQKGLLLNSERIEQKFGSYGVRVLESTSPGQRISCLYSTHDSKQICRTVAVTNFEDQLDPSLMEGHRLIVEEDQSIGATFKRLGWALTKENLYLGQIDPKAPCLFDFMGNIAPQPLAIHVYKLSLSKEEKKNLPYAIIAEIHHSDYLSTTDLKALFQDDRIERTDEMKSLWPSILKALASLKCEECEIRR